MPKPTRVPSGRHPAQDLRSIARSYTGLGIRTLVDVMQRSKVDATRVAAVALLFERGWGRAQNDANDHAEMRVIIRHIVEGPTGPGLNGLSPDTRVIEHVPGPGPDEQDPFA